jgi:two-component system, NtrC family, response regulator HydG
MRSARFPGGFERVGSSLTIGVDVRVIATSNRDLPKSVARGDFRQDLFFRLNVLPIHLPPLRDRLEDVPALVAHFVEQTARREGKAIKRFAPDAVEVMMQYAWPGNVRELQNICERASVLCKSDVVERSLVEPWLTSGETAALVPAAPVPAASTLAASNGHAAVLPGGSVVEPKVAGGTGTFIPLEGRQLEEIEREAIVRTLGRYNGHRQRTAEALGIGVRTLGLKIKKWKEMHLVEPGL